MSLRIRESTSGRADSLQPFIQELSCTLVYVMCMDKIGDRHLRLVQMFDNWASSNTFFPAIMLP